MIVKSGHAPTGPAPSSRAGSGAGTSGEAAAEALAMVAAVRDDPVRRLRLAGSFYDDRAGRAPIRAYRRAELAFMRWQVNRGVLAPPDSGHPGSQWWRSVNEGLLRDAWEADRLTAGRRGPASSPAVSRWADFLRKPSAQAWYRAHNSSVVTGYLEHRHLSEDELPLERFFMDVALARVLYMHALVTRPHLALGRLQAAGRLIGDPRRRGADLFLSLRNVLPDRYPLTGISISDILAAENYAGRLIDYGAIMPRIQSLYEFAAADLHEPRLLSLIQDGFPVYAWDYRERHAWTTARARAARSVLSWLTSALPAADARHKDAGLGRLQARRRCAPGPSETRPPRMTMVALGIVARCIDGRTVRKGRSRFTTPSRSARRSTRSGRRRCTVPGSA